MVGKGIQKVKIEGPGGVLDVLQSGTWDYIAGTGGGTFSITGRVVGLYAYANGSDGSLVIDGGDTITVRNNMAFILNPKGNLIDPTIVFSASLDYVVEFVNS